MHGMREKWSDGCRTCTHEERGLEQVYDCFLPSFIWRAAEAEALRLEVLSTPRAVYGSSIYTLKILAHDTPAYQSPSSANFVSCLRSNNLSTQPPGGKFLSHRLRTCTANTWLSLRSSPPPSARGNPPVQCPLLGSASTGPLTPFSPPHPFPPPPPNTSLLN